MAAAGRHALVDVFECAEPVLVGTHSIEEVRDQQPVHDEAGAIRRGDRLLPQRLCERDDGLVGLVARGQRTNDLDELHERHRAEEMEAAEPIGTPAGGRELRDAERRGVRQENGRLAHDLFERRVALALRVEVLDDGLDDEIARSQRLEGGRPREAAERLVAGFGGHLALGHAVVQKRPHSAEPLLEKALVDFSNNGPVAGRRRHLRDPRSHQSAPEHTHRFDCHMQP